jgi:hypothetical protein
MDFHFSFHAAFHCFPHPADDAAMSAIDLPHLCMGHSSKFMFLPILASHGLFVSLASIVALLADAIRSPRDAKFTDISRSSSTISRYSRKQEQAVHETNFTVRHQTELSDSWWFSSRIE